MKLLFLDIDGVLNPVFYFKKNSKKFSEDAIEREIDIYKVIRNT